MTGLVLKLGPHERVLVNGAVIENSDKRTKIVVMTRGAKILRLRDAIHPDEVNTPVRRLCYVAQLVLTGDCDPEEGRQKLLRGVEELSQILTDRDSRSSLDQATAAILEGQSYPALKALRSLLPREARLLGVTLA